MDEGRLLRHLFDAEHQPHNLLTTPTLDVNDTIYVDVEFQIRKFVALVILKFVRAKAVHV